MTVDTIQPEKKEVGSFKMFQAMVGIGIICALAIVVTYQTTLPVITKNKAEALEKAIYKVLPGAQTRKNFQWDGQKFSEADPSDHSLKDVIYTGLDANGAMVGIAIEAKGQGFQDAIQVLYGFDPEKQAIIGFYVLDSRETPGLGDKIASDAAFQENFKALTARLEENEKKLEHDIQTVKHGTKSKPWEIDAITGATISSKAVGNILNHSAQYWAPIIKAHIDELRTH